MRLQLLLLLFHECSNELRNFVGGGIEGEMARIEKVNFGIGHVFAVTFGLAEIE